MTIEETLELETEALAKTICEYSTNNYIRSYAMKLKELTYPKDTNKIKLLVDELLSWYEKHIDDILKQEFIHSKAEHQKSYHLLKNLKVALNHE